MASPITLRIKPEAAKAMMELSAAELVEGLSQKSLKFQIASFNTMDETLVRLGSYVQPDFPNDVLRTLDGNFRKYGEQAHPASEKQLKILAEDIERRYKFLQEKKAAGL